MSDRFLELTNPAHAYMFGFIQTDGHLSEGSRNRGKVTIELKIEDKTILEQFASMLPYHTNLYTRKRVSNFSTSFESAILQVFNKNFRDELLEYGMVYGKKSNVIAPPQCNFSRIDYFRGIIDGDGSLGITAGQFPFLSLVTASESLASAFKSFIKEVTGKDKNTSRNSRDGVYNICIYKEDAQVIVATLYYEDCIALPRKKRIALEILAWKRPFNMRRIDFDKKRWSHEEDSYILNHTIEEASAALERTAKSIKVRLWRLNTGNK